MHTQWIEQCTVQRVSLQEGLVLDLDDYSELVICRPMRLTLPAIGVLTGPREMVHGERESFIGGYRWQRSGPAPDSPVTNAGDGGCTRASSR
nr:DUF6188 family protein [Mycobacterium intracellulare]